MNQHYLNSRHISLSLVTISVLLTPSALVLDYSVTVCQKFA
jgi:hypothetical protein